MELVRDFRQLNKNDAAIAGGKGASLGEMTQAGIPVPPGFVLLSNAFEQFIEEAELKADIDAVLHTVNHEEVHTVEKASEEIKALILEEEIPKDIALEIKKHFKKLGAKWVAVRSSATAEDSSEAAWAGQLESYLNTTEKDLLENVKKCWASLFTPRAIFYRFEKGLHGTPISVAVVVQKMVESEVSGIGFSVHPVTQDYNQLIIEAGFGLGEAIVSGSITPDSYVVEKKGWLILDKHISSQIRALSKGKNGGNDWIELEPEKGNQPVLTEKEILELAKLIVKIEKHYGFPVDVEWCREKRKFFIVQSRPITTLKSNSSTAKKNAIVFEKAFSRDFCLAAIELAVRSEGLRKKPWYVEKPEHVPHLVAERADGTVHWYYHQRAWSWMNRQLVLSVQKDPSFLKKVEKRVLVGIKFIRPIYEKERALPVSELKRFIRGYLRAYPWIEAMWFLYRLTPQELGADNSSIKKIRFLTEKLSAGTDTVIRKSLAKEYPELGEYSAMIRLSEIKSGKIPALTELQKRDQGYFAVDQQLFVGLPRSELEEKFGIQLEQAQAPEKTEKISGEVACKGFAKGKVRRVMGHKEINQLLEGEILVSPMTMPDFLPAMKKAAAIVTDEGGQMCHAAIVARELGKPCIVGTKVATTILKDGDWIEVDANHGTVKILEKSAQ